jgi:Fe-S cluster biogenesis protein NfuA
MEKTKRYVNLYTESNPNPNSMKFVVNFMLTPEAEAVDYPSMESAQSSPLALALFTYPFVERVFIAANFITITKASDEEWVNILSKLKQFIREYLEEGSPVFDVRLLASQPEMNEQDDELVTRIKGILDEYVRPAVESDGGAISFHSFDSGRVKVKLQGSCSGCPSSTITLKAGIENLLKRMVPEVTEVVAEGA